MSTATKKMNVDDFLKENNTASAPKSGIPTIKKHAKQADSIFNALQELKDLETVVESKKSEFNGLLAIEYAAQAASGDFTKSFNVVGDKTPGVQITWKDQFSLIPLDQEAVLRAAVGKNFDKFFEQSRTIKLQETTDDDIQFLVEKLGIEACKKMFKITVGLKPKKGMDKNQFELKDEARELIKQYAPSIKVLK